MELHYLQEFITLAQTQNFLEAADILYMSQSTLSRHIKSLEDELGVALFRRTTRQVYLTKYGQMLLPYAHRISAQLDQFTDELAASRKEKDVCLRIGTIPAMNLYGISSILALFKKKYSQYTLNIISSHTVRSNLPDMLRRGICELAFVREDTLIFNDDIERIPLVSERIVAVVPKSHPFSSLSAIPLSTLKHENIVTFAKNTSIYDCIHAACIKAGFEPTVVMTDHSADHLIDCICLGMGIGLLLEGFIDPTQGYNDSIAVLPVEPAFSNYISLCYLKGAALSSAAEDFLRMYRESHPEQPDE